MRSDKVPCDGGCGAFVRKNVDWLYLFEMKVYCCDDCAASRFDTLYDQISFDWWFPQLKAEFAVKKANIIERLGTLSPTAMTEIGKRAYGGYKGERAMVGGSRRG